MIRISIKVIGKKHINGSYPHGMDRNITNPNNNKSFIDMATKILRTSKKATSACGNELKVVGEVTNFSVKIENIEHELNALVTKDHPEYIILGRPFIMENYAMSMNRLMSTKDTKNSSINHIGLRSLDRVAAEFELLFQTEISNLTLATLCQSQE